jgi:hypothetical protein
MPGPNNNNQTPQQFYAGQPTGSGDSRRVRRSASPSRLLTALQLGIVALTVGIVVFAVLSANGVL